MDYREFKRAAHRHLLTCQNLCSSLTSIESQEEKYAVMDDVYYLSGYVIETLLSYAIFCSCDLKTRKQPVESSPFYNKGFKTHDFQAKIRFATKQNCCLNGIVYIDKKHTNDEYMKRFNAWQIELRYRSLGKVSGMPTLNESTLCGYIDSLKEVEKQFFRKFL